MSGGLFITYLSRSGCCWCWCLLAIDSFCMPITITGRASELIYFIFGSKIPDWDATRRRRSEDKHILCPSVVLLGDISKADMRKFRFFHDNRRNGVGKQEVEDEIWAGHCTTSMKRLTLCKRGQFLILFRLPIVHCYWDHIRKSKQRERER